MPRSDLLAGVRDRSLDLAVLPGAARDDLRSAELWTDRAVVAMAAGHRLADEPAVAPAALARERVLVSRQQHGGEMHRFLAGRVTPLRPLGGALYNMGLPRLLDRVAAGEGVALICESHAALLGAEVVTRPVAAPAAEFAVSAYWPDSDPAGLLAELIAVLRDTNSPGRR
jgi:DNA-binding transcriptional LysR family regulator